MDKKSKIKLDEKKIIEKMHSGSMKRLLGGAEPTLSTCLAGCGCTHYKQCDGTCSV